MLETSCWLAHSGSVASRRRRRTAYVEHRQAVLGDVRLGFFVGRLGTRGVLVLPAIADSSTPVYSGYIWIRPP